mmetsp:Transcript_48367/g.149412  ORF Transcript_48367/g.149412 Transcript_48367/m.149412 type:complete len:260 (+) Transcript_48367:166-945(+)
MERRVSCRIRGQAFVAAASSLAHASGRTTRPYACAAISVGGVRRSARAQFPVLKSDRTARTKAAMALLGSEQLLIPRDLESGEFPRSSSQDSSAASGRSQTPGAHTANVGQSELAKARSADTSHTSSMKLGSACCTVRSCRMARSISASQAQGRPACRACARASFRTGTGRMCLGSRSFSPSRRYPRSKDRERPTNGSPGFAAAAGSGMYVDSFSRSRSTLAIFVKRCARSCLRSAASSRAGNTSAGGGPVSDSTTSSS